MTQERWQRATEWPLIIASILFLAAYAWQIVGDLHGPQEIAAETVIVITWLVFVADYIVRLVLAGQKGRWRWFYTHLFDFAVVFLPMLRPLRALRILTVLSVLQRTAGNAIRGRIGIYVGAAAALIIFVAALAVLEAERGAPGANIETFGDALWWAFVTVLTVGYGDFTPVTATGRMIAVGLMIGGIALLGVVTATLASWIVERVAEHDQEADAATVGHIHSLEQKVDELQRMVSTLQR